jgi:cob(I)alamin adenosyltransferase
MNIQLIQGQFSTKDAVDIITQMIHIKIKFQENKILRSGNEEDIKMRESRIKQLQKELFEARKFIEYNGTKINIQAEIHLLK